MSMKLGLSIDCFHFLYFSLACIGSVKATVSALSLVCLANCSFFCDSFCTCGLLYFWRMMIMLIGVHLIGDVKWNMGASSQYHRMGFDSFLFRLWIIYLFIYLHVHLLSVQYIEQLYSSTFYSIPCAFVQSFHSFPFHTDLHGGQKSKPQSFVHIPVKYWPIVKFFYWRILWKICNKMDTKHNTTVTPQLRRYTRLPCEI